MQVCCLSTDCTIQHHASSLIFLAVHLPCRALVLFMHQGILRSDDSRLVYMCDFMRPSILQNVGPSPCRMFLFLVKGGKTDAVSCDATSKDMYAGTVAMAGMGRQ